MSEHIFKNGDRIRYNYDEARFLCYDGDDAIFQSIVAKGLIIRADAKLIRPYTDNALKLSLSRDEVEKAIETSADTNDALVILGFEVTHE